jgi:type II secretory pathway component PulJ
MRRRLPHGLPRDEGTSLVELSIVMVILALITPIMFTALTSTMRVSNSTTAKALALSHARGSVEAIARDLRAGNPIDAITPVELYDTRVSFSTYCSDPGTGDCSAQQLKHVVYQLVGNALTKTTDSGPTSVTRTLVGPSGPAGYPESKQAGAVVHESSQPVFRFFDGAGRLLSTSVTSGAPASSFRDCAETVEIHLVVVSEPGEASHFYDVETKVRLRNYHPVQGC